MYFDPLLLKVLITNVQVDVRATLYAQSIDKPEPTIPLELNSKHLEYCLHTSLAEILSKYIQYRYHRDYPDIPSAAEILRDLS